MGIDDLLISAFIFVFVLSCGYIAGYFDGIEEADNEAD